MPSLDPHQKISARFLAERKAALLADEQRVGKTAAAIAACDDILANNILVVTKASARADWGHQFKHWGFYPRKIQVVYGSSTKMDAAANVVVVGWSSIYLPNVFTSLCSRRWDVLILDECHEAKNPTAKRTRTAWGRLAPISSRVWALSGTPIPNAPNDLFPMLAAIAPERLKADSEKGWGDVGTYDAFMKRYCVTYRKFFNGQWIEIVKRGKNERELRNRLEGFWMRRTQQDVGIISPEYSVLPLICNTDRDDFDHELLAECEKHPQHFVEAMKHDDYNDYALAQLRRVVGMVKAHAVVEAAADELNGGLDCLVLMCWHTTVIDLLKDQLATFGVAGIDGRTPGEKRQEQIDKFNSGEARVFVGQMLAAGEGINLSRANNLWFVEMSFVPKDMSQAAMRITHRNQKRQPYVRVCALEGSVDEAIAAILANKVASIKLTMEK